jgi:Protein of unknown function (DUF1275)
MATAVRILRLGRVFVANMTGNIAFTGFTITGAPGFSLSASLFALAGFMAGAAIGGPLGQPLLLLSAAAGELILVAAALGVAASAPVLSGVPRDIIAALPGSSFRSAPQRRSAWRPACWPWSPRAPRPPTAIRGPGARAVRAREQRPA